MKSKARATALRHPHIHVPTAEDMRGWLQKSSTKELEIDVTLVVLCSILLGSVLFSLYRAFGAYQCSL